MPNVVTGNVNGLAIVNGSLLVDLNRAYVVATGDEQDIYERQVHSVHLTRDSAERACQRYWGASVEEWVIESEGDQ